MGRMSVKLRVTLWYTLAMLAMTAVFFAVSSGAALGIIGNEAKERLVSTVEQAARRFFPVHMVTDNHQPPPPRGDMRFYDRGVHLSVFDANGNPLNSAVPFGIDAGRLDFADKELRTVTIDDEKYYVYDIRLENTEGAAWLKGMISADSGSFAFQSAQKTNMVFAVLLIILAAAGGYFIICRAFVPVSKISRTAKEISESSDLTARINIGSGKDEISSLANTFDDMLDKIEQTFEKEKQFTSDASHELRTPAAVIMSECEYMLDCAESPEEFRESAASVKRQAERMTKLISELLAISRMDQNTMKLNFEETDISELATFICSEQQEINGGKVWLFADIKPGITAVADRFLLARLFINLVSNAYQYTPDGGEIRVSLVEEGGMVVFSVSDNGIGISEESLPRIWERFYRADTSRTDSGSSGLGLSMVKQIAKCHGGRVTVTSRVGDGSCFEFRFPKNPYR